MGTATVGERAARVRDIRKERQKRIIRRLLIGVVLPTALAAIYYATLASPQYQSNASFTVRSADGNAGGGFQLLLAQVPGGNAGRDALLVQEFIQSRDMLELLESEHGFVDHYRNNGDVFSRLAEGASIEDRFDYYLEHVTIAHDTQSGVLTLETRAFSAEYAQQMNAAIVAASEAMVNALNERARRDRMNLAETELRNAERRLTEARQAVLRFQSQHEDINPVQSAAAILEVRATLEAELASARAELSALRRTLQRGAPEVIEQRRRVAALQSQIAAQTRRLSGEEGGLNIAIAEFEPMMVEKEFAQRAYQSALTAVELARVEADRQHRYLVQIAAPSQPDASTYPNAGRGILQVFIVCFVALGIGSLLLASVREHANL